MEKNVTSKYQGYTEAEATEDAEAEGYTVRVTSRDGNHYMVTRDYRTDRVNLTVANNRVIRATIG